jgi:hypothetical protein
LGTSSKSVCLAVQRGDLSCSLHEFFVHTRFGNVRVKYRKAEQEPPSIF